MNDANPTAPIAPPLGVDRETFTLAYVAAHEAQCPACGYNMHALTIARCPECGRPFEVRLVAPVGISKAWIVLLVTTAIGRRHRIVGRGRLNSGRHPIPAPARDQILRPIFPVQNSRTDNRLFTAKTIRPDPNCF